MNEEKYPRSSIEDDFNYGTNVASASVHIRMGKSLRICTMHCGLRNQSRKMCLSVYLQCNCGWFLSHPRALVLFPIVTFILHSFVVYDDGKCQTYGVNGCQLNQLTRAIKLIDVLEMSLVKPECWERCYSSSDLYPAEKTRYVNSYITDTSMNHKPLKPAQDSFIQLLILEDLMVLYCLTSAR